MSDAPAAISGILPVDKPAGLTSHDVVARVRRLLGVKRVGHAGTLDPMATGLLVVLVGSATRLARFVEAGAKGYEGRVVFGSSTDTDDAEGEVTATAEVPSQLADPALAAAALREIVGPIEQVPPVYAAIKIDGRKAYDLARRGEAPEMAPRSIIVHSAALLAVDAGPPVTWDVALDVSRGTYVRAIARDLGLAQGTLAHLGALRRTGVGALTVAEAIPLDQLLEGGPMAALACFADPRMALGLPVRELTPEEAQDVSHGKALPSDAESPQEGGSVALIAAGELVAVYVEQSGTLKPDVVLSAPLHMEPCR